MANQLYPVFEIPSIWQDDTENEQAFKPGPLFDFDIGDFVRDGSNRVIMCDGRDEYILWVLKMLKTQRWACPAYSDECGIDAEDAAQQPSRRAVQSAFERTITEALLVNPCTERVYGFDYEWSTDELEVTFIVKPRNWDAFDVNMNVVT